MGDWKYFTRLPEKYSAVTVESVNNVTRKYLNEDTSTVGYFIPKPKPTPVADRKEPESKPLAIKEDTSKLFIRSIPIEKKKKSCFVTL